MAVKSLKRSSVKSTQKTNAMNAGYSFQDFELIESVFLSANTATVTFSNLNRYATEYSHLQIRCTTRSTANQIWDSGSLRFNDDSSNNYAVHSLGGIGLYSEAGTSRNNISILSGGMPGATLTTNSFGASIIDILDAYSTVKNKTIREFNGATGGEFRVRLGSGLWINTTPINNIALTCSGNFVASSRFSIYGIR